MGRKAKEAAQQKIGVWTNASRRNVSKTTTATKENANTSNNENRAPLQTQSQSAINAMKNVSVRLERMDAELEKLLFSPPKPPVSVVEKIFKKDNNSDNKNIYDYTFDTDDIPLDNENEDAMKNLIDKLAKENKIVVKKYRAKNVKKQPEKKETKGKASKRRREKQPAEIEPPQKKPNLKIKKLNVVTSTKLASTGLKTRSKIENLENNNNLKNDVIAEKGKNLNSDKAIPKNPIKDLINNSITSPRNDSLIESPVNFARLRLRNQTRPNLQSTPKSSTPLKTKTGQSSNLTFENESPVVTEIMRLAQADLKRQRLSLSDADDSTGHERIVSICDDDEVPFINLVGDGPSTSYKQDKENSYNIPGTSAMVNNSPKKNVLRPSDDSLRVFSPTKRRVYGRSPLKNITSEVNNTNSTFDSIKSIPSISDTFGTIPRPASAQLSRSTDASKEITKRPEVTLPEAEYLTVRRSSVHPNHFETDADVNVDNCFGFDDDDDDDDDDESVSKQGANAKALIGAEKAALKETRANLKRFLHNVDSTESTSKKMKPVVAPKRAQKKLKSPVKEKAIFNDAHATKQKDIRNAFTAKSNDKEKSNNSNDNLSAALFEEVETVQDRRKSYSRPAKQYRKRRISVDSEPEEDEDDEDMDKEGKKSKAKRRKKLVESDPKESEELEEFAKAMNEHFDDIDHFEMVVE